jgi:hypothetical protein
MTLYKAINKNQMYKVISKILNLDLSYLCILRDPDSVLNY